MPTLSSTFKLYDNYSNAANRILKTSDLAGKRMVEAANKTDRFSTALKRAGMSAGNASGKFISLAGAVGAFVGIKKFTDIADTFTNTAARIALINDGLQDQAALQDKIFASAQRSRGSYTDMSNAIAKMGLLAGENFGSNNELIGFTELVQKSFKIGGASSTEQQNAMLQLSQAMAAGKLQGDEFRSITENAPMIAAAIAKYTGKSKGELKELSADGAITADIIKNAMFAMSDDIEDKFKQMPVTFADAWNKISNNALKSFAPAFDKFTKILNSDATSNFIDGVSKGVNVAASGFLLVTETVQRYWSIAGPILGGLTISALFSAAVASVKWAFALKAVTWQFALVALSISWMIYMLDAAGVTASDVFGFIGGSLSVLEAAFHNVGAGISNFFTVIMQTIDQTITLGINKVIDGWNSVASKLNTIPGVNVKTFSSFGGIEKGGYAPEKQYKNLAQAYYRGSYKGKMMYSGGVDKMNELASSVLDFSQFGSAGNPLKVDGTGKGGAVKVDMSDENLKYLKEVAEREYINKFSTATLAPNMIINFEGSGDTSQDDRLAKRVQKILREQIAIAAEGV